MEEIIKLIGSNGEIVELTEEEVKYLTGKSKYTGGGRCDRCGHLYALHNSHCCSFCMVDECECEM